jgi:hypothetical protein
MLDNLNNVNFGRQLDTHLWAQLHEQLNEQLWVQLDAWVTARLWRQHKVQLDWGLESQLQTQLEC